MLRTRSIMQKPLMSVLLGVESLRLGVESRLDKRGSKPVESQMSVSVVASSLSNISR